MSEFAQLAKDFEEVLANIPKPSAVDLQQRAAYIETHQQGLAFLTALSKYLELAKK